MAILICRSVYLTLVASVAECLRKQVHLFSLAQNGALFSSRMRWGCLIESYAYTVSSHPTYRGRLLSTNRVGPRRMPPILSTPLN
jgi:hypothetical protein